MPDINKKHLVQRIEDWINRIDTLYSEIRMWLSNVIGVTVDTHNCVEMYEEFMEKFQITKVQLPIADIKKNNELIMSIKPMGLWVIGANGRLDILTHKGVYILVDTADYFDTPKWKVFTPTNRTEGEQLTKKFIIELISDL